MPSRPAKKPVENINVKHKQALSSIEKFALWITTHIGTMGFFLAVFLWSVGWISWNLFAPENWRFDTVPAFELWLFISNLIQLFFLPLIMIGQNLQGRHSEMRAEADFEINKKAEAEIETIFEYLEKHSRDLEEIIKSVQNKKRKNG